MSEPGLTMRQMTIVAQSLGTVWLAEAMLASTPKALLMRLIRYATQQEREACARVVESYRRVARPNRPHVFRENAMIERIATEIRERAND